jgi:hypothetical protein
MRFALLLLLGINAIIVTARPIDTDPTTLPEFLDYVSRPSGPNEKIQVDYNYHGPLDLREALEFHRAEIKAHELKGKACSIRAGYQAQELSTLSREPTRKRKQLELMHRNDCTKAALHAAHAGRHQEIAEELEERIRNPSTGSVIVSSDMHLNGIQYTAPL